MRLGLEAFLEEPRRWTRGGRIGLLAHAASVDREFRHVADRLVAHPEVDLRILFGPEHGIRGAAQDMVGVPDGIDPITGLREVSLYGDSVCSLRPSQEVLREIDVLVVDLQDVGSRYYTYAATMALCMEVARETDVEVVVLDRPNPINGVDVEGGGILPGYESFCGLYPIPQRHGMTIGELARLYNDTFGIGCRLEVVPCDGWDRTVYHDQLGLPWVLPSPNMPTLDTALVYPGTCLVEGTNLSEGRGTTRPFELVGAPFVDGRALAEELHGMELDGVRFRPCWIEPAFHKHAGRRCGAVQLHVVDRAAFRPYRTGLALLHAVHRLWPEQFRWRTEPYEFRNDVPAVDLLTGTPAVREAIDRGESFATVLEAASVPADAFHAGRPQALLY